MPTYTIKKRDTAPLIRDTLLDGDGNPANFTGASGKFHMASWDLGIVIVAAGTVTGWNGVPLDATGQVEYAPAAPDVANAGVFKAEWEVTFAGGKVETWPNEGWAVVNVETDLA